MRGLTDSERRFLLQAKRALDTGEDQPYEGFELEERALLQQGRIARCEDDEPEPGFYITQQGLGALIADDALRAVGLPRQQ